MTTDDRLQRIESLLETNNQRLENLERDIKEFDIRIETYQKASQQVVNLAFSLIVAATAAIVIPVVVGR
jgi:hypothetical protein